MHRWRSRLWSLTILGLLFWLGTAMAPSTSGGGPTTTTSSGVTTTSANRAFDRPLLPWPPAYCAAVCPDPPVEPSQGSDEWRPTSGATTTTAAPHPPREPVITAARPPAAAPRPVEEWRSLVAAYFLPGDVDQALRVISCESGGDPNAQNASSGAAGLFQHIPAYWEARAAAAGMSGASIYDPIANVAVSAYLVYTDGWGHWSASAACW